MKKIISFLCAAVLILSCTLAVQAADSTSGKDFTDVPKDAWYYQAVNSMVEKGIFQGVGNQKFSPGTATTRAMFIQILYNLTEDKNTEDFGVVCFKDTAEKDWFYPAVQWGGVNHITNGTSINKFSPHAELTREQAVKLLFTYMDFTGNNTTSAANALTNYKDTGKLSSWAVAPMQWAVHNGVVKGVSQDRLDPKGKLTRAQAVQLMANIYPLIINKKLSPQNMNSKNADLREGPEDGKITHYVDGKALFTYTIPESWKGKYLLQETADHNYGVYERISKIRGGLGYGRLFSFWVSPKGTEEVASRLVKVSDVRLAGKDYTIYLFLPTDVQFFDGDSQTIYVALKTDIQGIADHIQYADGVTKIDY